MSDEQTPSTLYRGPLVEALGGECESCGSSSELEIHHLDGDRENNRIENLQLLCHDCHQETHSSREQYDGDVNPDEILRKEVNQNGQIYLGRDLGGKRVIVAYEIYGDE